MTTRLQELVTDRGLTNEALWKKTGIEATTLDKYLQGDKAVSEMDSKDLETVAKALKVSAHHLLEETKSDVDGISFHEGWNDLSPYLSVYVDEDSKIRRGLAGSGNSQYTVYLYHKRSDGLERIPELTVDEFKKLRRNGYVSVTDGL